MDRVDVGVLQQLFVTGVPDLDAEAVIADVLRCLDGGLVRVTGLSTEKPSLDDVFLNVTGRRIRTEAADRPINLGWM